jgi:hypothetical protein
MLARQPLKQEFVAHDDAYLRRMMVSHPYPEYFTVGVRFFWPQKNSAGHLALYAQLNDGTRLDVGYRCFGKPRRPEWQRHVSAVHKAMRLAVSQQNLDLRRPGYEVHHEIPFRQLVTLFFGTHRCVEGSRGLSFDELGVEVKPLNCGVYELLNPKFKRLWQDFHQAHATVTALTQEEHRHVHARSRA